MTIRFTRPVSIAARWAWRLAFLSLLLLVAAWLGFRFGPLSMPSFVLAVLLCGGLAALSVPFALWGLWRLWSIGAKGGLAASRALVIAALPLSVLGLAAERYQTRPELYEVVSDLTDPPGWILSPGSKSSWLPRPPTDAVVQARLQAEAYPTLTVRRYDGALDRVYQAVRKVASDQRWSVTATRGAAYARPDFQAPAPASGTPAGPAPVPVPTPRPQPQAQDLIPDDEPPGVIRIQATTRNFILGFPFDILIRLREEEETVLVDIRVSSRYGPHDLGFAAAIANGYLTALDGELLGIASQ
ncbi:DUF1499 domain-containing protein [Agrobacterium vitis]|uniref:DUF1499 domain-containing protein n=1 Tax=Agrobacterium vitis TaxID=373 RepID=UPI003D274529